MPLIRITETEETTKKPMDLLPEGMYEVFVESVDTPEAFGEFEKSTLVLKIRNDSLKRCRLMIGLFESAG